MTNTISQSRLNYYNFIIQNVSQSSKKARQEAKLSILNYRETSILGSSPAPPSPSFSGSHAPTVISLFVPRII